MQFASFGYLLFLSVVASIAFAWPRHNPQGKRWFVLAASYFFYATLDIRFLVVVCAVTLVAHFGARFVSRAEEARKRKAMLSLAVGLLLTNLAVFRYVAELEQGRERLIEALGLTPDTILGAWFAPLGLSFYTFVAIGYLVDVYRGKIVAERTFAATALFVSFFPQILSGPIGRAGAMLPQIAQMPRPTAEQLQQGVLLMMRGFAKKLLLADVLGQYLVDPAIEDTAVLSAPLLLLGLYGFTLQLYFDLSGYTDLARGAGKLLGIELMRNFNRPYHAASVSEFWQRWHISMSSFFRDYLYFAVGGSKHGNVYLNLLITFVAIGVWHGAGWNFVVYGALHGSLVAWERFWRTRKGRSFNGVSNRLLGIALTFHFVVFSRVLFVEHSLADALDFLDRLSSFSNWTLRGSVGFPPIVPAALVISLFLAFMPADISRRLKAAYTCLPALVQAGLIVLLVYVCMAVSVDQAAFVYFRF